MGRYSTLFSVATEREIAARYKQGETTPALAVAYGCCTAMVGNLLKRMGVALRHAGPPRMPDELRAIAAHRYEGGEAMSAIAESLGWSESAIKTALVKHGVSARSTSEACRKICLREGFFETIDTEAKAAYLGFITADGCVHRRANCGASLSVAIHSKDRDYLEHMAAALGDVTVHDYINSAGTPVSKIAACSTRLVDDLARLGVGPRKSKTAEPWNGPEHLMRHYWRGCFEGDGGFVRCTTRTGRVQWGVGFCGSEAMVHGFTDFIGPRIDSASRPFRMKSIWSVRYGGSRVVRDIARILYRDATVCLERKKLLADEAMALVPGKIIRDPAVFGREQIKEAYRSTGNWYAAADSLGMHYMTLLRLRRHHGIKEPNQQRTDRSWLTVEWLEQEHARHGDWYGVAAELGMSYSGLRDLRKQIAKRVKRP